MPRLHRFGTQEDLRRLKDLDDMEETDPSDDDESGLTPEQRKNRWETIWKRNHMYSCPLVDLKFSNNGTMFGLLDSLTRTADGQVERDRRLQDDEGMDESDEAGTGDDKLHGCAPGEIQGKYIGGQESEKTHLAGKAPISRDFFFFTGLRKWAASWTTTLTLARINTPDVQS